MYLNKVLLFCSIAASTFCCRPDVPDHKDRIVVITTTKDGTLLLDRDTLMFSKVENNQETILVDSSYAYQPIIGFGYTLTGASAKLIHDMKVENRLALLHELFGQQGKGLDISTLRISMAASDLDDEVFSYLDLPFGTQDTSLQRFNLSRDTLYLIPVLKQALKINPKLKIMASPWSAPTWMKTNNHSVGGALLTQYYDTYSKYFIKYIQAMAGYGINIDYVTIQNEPQHGGNNPSMLMSAAEQALFIKKFLGPKLRAAQLNTKIAIFDHNCNNYQYPLTILNDDEAFPYIDGTAFHLYEGDISAMSIVNDSFPDKNLFFTEQWTSGKGDFGDDLMWHYKNVVIGALSNWAGMVMEWNLASDPLMKHHTKGGCELCQGAITIDKNNYKRNVSYYVLAHASRYIKPASQRIKSTGTPSLPCVCFKTKDKKIICLIMNESQIEKKVSIVGVGKPFVVALKASSINTIIF